MQRIAIGFTPTALLHGYRTDELQAPGRQIGTHGQEQGGFEQLFQSLFRMNASNIANRQRAGGVLAGGIVVQLPIYGVGKAENAAGEGGVFPLNLGGDGGAGGEQ